MLTGRGQTGCSYPVGKGLKWYHLPGGERGHIHDRAIPPLELWLTKIDTDIHKDLTTTMFFGMYFITGKPANNLNNYASVEKNKPVCAHNRTLCSH